MQLKRTVEASLGGLWGDEPTEAELGIPVARVADFAYADLTLTRAPTRRRVPPSQARDRILRPGDLLIEKSGGGERQNVGRVVRWAGDEESVFSNFINVLRPAPGFDARWLVYLHRHLYLSGAAANCTKQSTGIQNLDLGAYLATQIRAPSIEDQCAIADFLGRECERIAILESELRVLDGIRGESYERLLADEVGVDRWTPVQVRYVATPGTGHTPSREHPNYWVPDECIIPWFTLADVWQIRDDERLAVSETAEKVSLVGVANSSAAIHPRETVLLSRTASVGFSAVMELDMAVSQDFMTWTCGPKLDPYFLLFALRAIRPELRRLMTGSTHKTIYMPDLHALRIPLPDVPEQRRAVQTLQAVLARHWGARAELEAVSRLLTEYRDALITEAVTGKLDVTRLSEQQLGESALAAMEGDQPEVLSA